MNEYSSNSDEDYSESDCERLVFSLKDGLALSDVKNEGGTEFELDVQKDLADENAPGNQHYFDNTSVFENLYSAAALGEVDGKSDESDGDDDEPFETIRSKMEPLVTDRGVMKRVKKSGFGGVPPEKAEVVIHYNAYLELGDEPFDSTRLRNRPHKFILDCGQVIRGLDIAVASMRQSEVAEFIIEPLYAYGAMGCPPRIPANMPILYVVELVKFEEFASVIEYQEMTTEDRKVAPFAKVLGISKAHNQAGNELYKSKNYSRALYRYNKAIQLLSDVNMANEEEEKEQQKLLLKLYLNVSQCHLCMNAADRAIPCSIIALKIDPDNSKALFRCGKANRLNGCFEKAKFYLQKLARKEPNNREAAEELEKLSKDMIKYMSNEKDFCSKLFPGWSNQSASKPPEPKLEVTEDFKESILKNLKEFQDKEEVAMMPFTIGFSDSEIEAVKKIATDLGLFCVVPERGEAKLRVYKVLPK